MKKKKADKIIKLLAVKVVEMEIRMKLLEDLVIKEEGSDLVNDFFAKT